MFSLSFVSRNFLISLLLSSVTSFFLLTVVKEESEKAGYVEVGSFYAYFLKSFNLKWVLNFVKGFSASIEIIIWFLSFNLLIWCITLIDLHILKNPCIPGINPT